MASLKKTTATPADEIATQAASEIVDLAALEVETADVAEVDVKPADLRQGELLDALADKTGLRKSDLKLVLAALGSEVSGALMDGRTVKWRELGVLKPTKQKDTPGGPVAICRLKPAKPADPLADAAPEVAPEPTVDAAE